MDFIRTLEDALGCRAVMRMLPMQAGDVHTTYADTTKLRQAVGYCPATSLKEGIGRFAGWYRSWMPCAER